jgi:hypothetical protein
MTSLLTTLSDEIGCLLAPLALAADSPQVLQELLAELGVDGRADTVALSSALRAVIDLQAELETLAQQPFSFEGLSAALEVVQHAVDALRRLDDISNPVSGIEGFGRDLCDILLSLYLGGRHPVARQIGVLLTLLEPAEEQDSSLPEVQDGRLLRAPFRLDRFHFERIVSVLHDPLSVLRAEYGNALQTLADANAMAARLFPRLQRLLQLMGLVCRYGYRPGDEDLLGGAGPLLEHALVIFTSQRLDSGVVLTLSSADLGDLGLVISPFGTLDSTRQAGPFSVEMKLTAGVDTFAYGRHGLTLVASPETTAVDAGLAGTLVPIEDGPAVVLGSPDGTRIELGGGRLSAETTLSAARQTLALAGDVSSSSFVIDGADGDGFLASILPAGGMRTNFDIGLVWSSENGLTLRGSSSLETLLPVGLSVGPVALPVVYVGLRPHDDSVDVEVSGTITATIGPVQAIVDRTGILGVLTFPDGGGNLGGRTSNAEPCTRRTA